jgi:hypothetical protein
VKRNTTQANTPIPKRKIGKEKYSKIFSGVAMAPPGLQTRGCKMKVECGGIGIGFTFQ